LLLPLYTYHSLTQSGNQKTSIEEGKTGQSKKERQVNRRRKDRSIEEGKTTQMSKEKGQKDKQ
jgi:hypothetical protein